MSWSILMIVRLDGLAGLGSLVNFSYRYFGGISYRENTQYSIYVANSAI